MQPPPFFGRFSPGIANPAPAASRAARAGSGQSGGPSTPAAKPTANAADSGEKSGSGGKGRPQSRNERADELVTKWATIESDDVRFFGKEKAAQLKALSRLMDDLKGASEAEGAEPIASVNYKKIHIIYELTKSINRYGAESPEFGKSFDSLAIHFAGLSPEADLEHAEWILQARFKSKALEVSNCDFWRHISQKTATWYKVTTSLKQLQHLLTRDKISSITRVITDATTEKLKAFSSFKAEGGINSVEGLDQDRVAPGTQTCPCDHQRQPN